DQEQQAQGSQQMSAGHEGILPDWWNAAGPQGSTVAVVFECWLVQPSAVGHAPAANSVKFTFILKSAITSGGCTTAWFGSLSSRTILTRAYKRFGTSEK